jgi:hypothetical protein
MTASNGGPNGGSSEQGGSSDTGQVIESKAV